LPTRSLIASISASLGEEARGGELTAAASACGCAAAGDCPAAGDDPTRGDKILLDPAGDGPAKCCASAVCAVGRAASVRADFGAGWKDCSARRTADCTRAGACGPTPAGAAPGSRRACCGTVGTARATPGGLKGAAPTGGAVRPESTHRDGGLNFLSGEPPEPLRLDDRTGVAIPNAGEVGLNALAHRDTDRTFSAHAKRSVLRVGLVADPFALTGVRCARAREGLVGFPTDSFSKDCEQLLSGVKYTVSRL